MDKLEEVKDKFRQELPHLSESDITKIIAIVCEVSKILDQEICPLINSINKENKDG